MRPVSFELDCPWCDTGDEEDILTVRYDASATRSREDVPDIVAVEGSCPHAVGERVEGLGTDRLTHLTDLAIDDDTDRAEAARNHA